MYIVAALSPCGVYLDSVQLRSEGIGTNMVNCSWFPESSDPTVCVDEPLLPVCPQVTVSFQFLSSHCDFLRHYEYCVCTISLTVCR